MDRHNLISVLEKPKPLRDSFTSNGSKHYWHQEKMQLLRSGVGRPITTTIILTDHCAHKCAFCSVSTRDGDVLPWSAFTGYLDIMQSYGLLSATLSGGGNPLLFKEKEGKRGINDAVDELAQRGLKIGLITDGMALKEYENGRRSWRNLSPERIDALQWCRISLAGLDHEERDVYVPDFDHEKTTVGFSWVLHDVYTTNKDPNHGRVSTLKDYLTFEDISTAKPIYGKGRLPWVRDKIGDMIQKHKPKYVRLIANCLEPELLDERCDMLQEMADSIDPTICFVQKKAPSPPHKCFAGYPAPTLNCDGWLFPCTSTVLNDKAGHRFAEPWRMCRWDRIGEIYDAPVRSLIDDPKTRCPNCVFKETMDVLQGVVDGTADITPPSVEPTHSNFV